MRIRLIILLIFSGISLYGQNKNSSYEITDCELLTHKTIDKLTIELENHQFASFDTILSEWIKQCGISECTQRLIVLENIINDNSSMASIQKYLENDLLQVFRNRIEYSKRINFGYIYSDSKAYYGYVPLRHKIDSVIMKESLYLLKTKRLNLDEKLICILFSGNIEEFDDEIKKNEYNKSFIKQYLKKVYRDINNRWLSYTIYLGVFTPIKSNDIFSTSPMFGLTFSSPLNYKYIVELGMKVRLNINDDSFNYYALGETNLVNSDYSIFFGGLIGYKIYESKNMILMPKFGIGLESIDTGLSEKKKNSADTTYYNIETIHLSLGFSAMIPVFNKSYLGFGINYHYCPYQLDAGLINKFDNDLISTEIFWRF